MSAWKSFERQCAALFGGSRFWANSGEALDFESDQVVGQCKLRKHLSLEALTQLAEQARADGLRLHKLGVVCAKVRRGRDWRKNATEQAPTLIVMTAETFDEWFSMRTRGKKG